VDVKARPDLKEYARVIMMLGFPVVSEQEQACQTLWSMIGDDAASAKRAAEAHAVAALVLLLDVRKDRRGVASTHNHVPSLFLSAVNALTSLAQDETTARPQLVSARAAAIAQQNVAHFEGSNAAMHDAVRRLVAAEAGDPLHRISNDLLVPVPSSIPETTQSPGASRSGEALQAVVVAEPLLPSAPPVELMGEGAAGQPGDVCGICCDASMGSTRLWCGHAFCAQCLANWALSENENSKLCPTCRQPISNVPRRRAAAP